MASRRHSGEGSITKRKDGRWMGRYTVTLPNGVRKRQSITKKDKQAVIEQMQREIAQANQGMPVDRTKYPLEGWVRYWLENVDKQKVKPATWHKHKYHLERLILPKVGHISVASLTPTHVRSMLNQWLEAGVGKRICQQGLLTLSAVMRDAVKQELVHRNVVRLVDPPKYQVKERHVWTKEQAETFLDGMRDHRYYGVFLVFFSYGMRRGEVFGLHWRDVDFAKETISVNQSLSLAGKEYILTTPKTKSSLRTLPLTPAVREVLLAEHAKRNPAPDDFLFVSNKGTHLDPGSFRTMFERHSYRLGLPRLTPHEIRHTVATLMKDGDVPPKDAQTILGHSSIATTMDIYTHSTSAKKSEALTTVSKSLGVL